MIWEQIDLLMETNKLTVLIERLKRLGITIECGGNLPWIYLDYINGKRVTEIFRAEHGFCIGLVSLKGDFKFTDTKEIFKLIRKYS